jgi:hypothetical protein
MRGTRTASLSTRTGSLGAIDALLMIFAKDSYLDMLAAAGGRISPMSTRQAQDTPRLRSFEGLNAQVHSGDDPSLNFGEGEKSVDDIRHARRIRVGVPLDAECLDLI